MKINLSLKYWGKHRKRAFSIILAFLTRSASVSYLEAEFLDVRGGTVTNYGNEDFYFGALSDTAVDF